MKVDNSRLLLCSISMQKGVVGGGTVQKGGVSDVLRST